MSKKTLKFGNIRLNKNEFHKSKQPIQYLINLSIVMMVLNILLVTEKVKLLNSCVLSYVK